MANEDPAVTRFRQYLRIKTISGNEDPKPDYPGAVQFLQHVAADFGLIFDCVEVAPERPVVVITWTGTKPGLPSIMLNSHMDVVPVYPESWSSDPFAAVKLENGDIIARGSQDMKCVGMQYLEAIKRLKQAGVEHSRTIHVTFVPDEEIGGELGMKLFVKHDKFKEFNIGFALDEGLANPTDAFTLFYGERSPWWFKVICTGNPGHGSRFIEDTAAEKLMKMINHIMEYRETQKNRLRSDPRLKLGDVTSVNVNMLQGGVQVNVVPQEMSAVIDMRVTPTQDHKQLEELIQSWLSDAGSGCTIEFIYKAVNAGLTSVDSSSPWWVAFSQACDKQGVKLELEVFPAATDGRYLREIGIPVLGFSPMNNTPILLHDHNERLNEKVFLRGIEIYQQIIPALTKVP